MLTLQLYIRGIFKDDHKSENWHANIRILRNDGVVGDFTIPLTAKEADQLKPAAGRLTDPITIKF